MTPQDKLNQYIGCFLYMFNTVKTLLLGPKPEPTPPNDNLQQYIHSGAIECPPRFVFTKDLSVAKVKAASKKLGVSINDMMLAVVTASISDYATLKKIPLKRETLNVLYGLKGMPESKKDFYYYNLTYSEFVGINFSSDFNACLI